MSSYVLQLESEVGAARRRNSIMLQLLTFSGTRERHLESIIQSSLRQIILIHNFPRTLIQVTLQITSTPDNDFANSKLNQASSVRFPSHFPVAYTKYIAIESRNPPSLASSLCSGTIVRCITTCRNYEFNLTGNKWGGANFPNH